ncbi:MAG: methyl-accepting chemotaxis protein [Phycisphaerales bacterium]|nr:methyl-accepting chemotaxis protein [Phycisphaerales bacterium]
MTRLFGSLGLSTKIIAVVTTVLVVVVGVNYAVFIDGYDDLGEQLLLEKATAFTAIIDEVQANGVAQLDEGIIDREALLERAKERERAGVALRNTEYFNSIPLVSAWRTGERSARAQNFDFRVVSFNARFDDHRPQRGTMSADLLSELERQVAAGGQNMVSRYDASSNSMYVLRSLHVHPSAIAYGHPLLTDAEVQAGNNSGRAVDGAYELVIPLDDLDATVAGFTSRAAMMTVPLVVVALAGFVWILRVLLTRPINSMVTMVRDIAEGEGDLTKRLNLERKDEIGQLAGWFDTFMQRLQTLIGDVAGATREVASASTEIAASSEELATGINEQDAQITQISAAMEEMSASVVEVARKSADAAKNADESGKIAHEGGEVVGRTIEGMHGIRDAVSDSADSVAELGKKGEQIGQIVAVINDIADQTNLLALNAAIEAARAGEHGRGFAVVADEVRKLAERTQRATEEIGDSIQIIQVETKQAVERMNIGSEQVKTGADLATQAGDSLQRIVTSASDVAAMIQTIAAAAEQQAATSEEVSKSIESISAVTRQSSEGVGQAATAAAQLSSKAEQLQALVGRFKIAD